MNGSEEFGEYLNTIGRDVEGALEVSPDFKPSKINYRWEDKSISFWERYDIYLASEIWQKKRDLVLKRDNNTCQSCLVRKAEQIHHKNYRHVFNEPLFDLVSVCEKCHNSITLMERRQKFDPIDHDC